VINRPYIKVNKNYIKSAYFINMPPINIASSQLRINPDSKYLTKPIISYIAKHFLYAQEQVAAILSTARYQHSLRVAKLAKSLAIDCGYKNLATKAYIAGIYHDVCKELHKNDLIKYVGKYDHKRFVDYHTLHGLAGAKYIHQRFHINDKQILNAIANHVIPAPNPSPLDMIIYCADKLEPARTNSDISNRSKFIALSRKDLKSTFIKLNKEIQEQYN
jgi:nicotinate-nucleotide adenylyltransferase